MMDAVLKAIDTKYAGYLFRSRTEARWAVFFNALGIKFEYEVQGFDLNGIWYLPDFFISDHNDWIEVKGQEPTDEEKEKCNALARASDKSVLIVVGIPSTEPQVYWFHPMKGCYGDINGLPMKLQFTAGGTRELIKKGQAVLCMTNPCITPAVYRCGDTILKTSVDEAIEKARYERFSSAS